MSDEINFYKKRGQAVSGCNKPCEQKMGNEKIVLGAHMSGAAVALCDVDDEIFAQGFLGKGAAIEPNEGKLYAPCDGKIGLVFDTLHALNIITSSGCEILLHIGIDTVRLKGRHFKAHVKCGENVKKGDLLISFNLEALQRAGYKTTSPMIICNSAEYKNLSAVTYGNIRAGNDFLEIEQ